MTLFVRQVAFLLLPPTRINATLGSHKEPAHMAFADTAHRYSAHTAECAYGNLENINAKPWNF